MSLCHSLESQQTILGFTSAPVLQVQMEGLGEQYKFTLISRLYNSHRLPHPDLCAYSIHLGEVTSEQQLTTRGIHEIPGKVQSNTRWGKVTQT